MRRRTLGLAGLAGAAAAVAVPSVAAASSDFRCALDAHLGAIERRDLNAYAATLDEDCTLIFRSGTTLAGKKAIVDWHREWFATPGWTQTVTVARTVVRRQTAVAVMHAVYRDATGETKLLFSLTFSRADGRWRVLHDQVASRA